jgi:hypothetical protein
MSFTHEWLQTLIADRQEESERLEFKSCLPDRSDKGKLEFLKDVAAMANAEGGDIIFGVGETEGVATAIEPLSSEESVDEAIRRLSQSLDSSIEPRVAGVICHPLPLPAGGYVLKISVPRSFTGPHRVTFQDKNIFFVRAQRHVSQFSYSQLREAFNLRMQAEDRMRAFRAERLAHIKSGHGRSQIKSGARYVIHILPLVSFAEDRMINLSTFMPRANDLLFGRRGNVSTYWNLDGILARAHLNQEQDYKYVQLFRTGAIETAGFAGALINDGKFIPATFLASEFRKALIAHGAVLGTLEIKGPVAVSISMLSVGDYKLAPTEYDAWATDRHDLMVPELWATSAETLAEKVDDIARPALDTLWQCFDVNRCTLYDEHGAWQGGQ